MVLLTLFCLLIVNISSNHVANQLRLPWWCCWLSSASSTSSLRVSSSMAQERFFRWPRGISIIDSIMIINFKDNWSSTCLTIIFFTKIKNNGSIVLMTITTALHQSKAGLLVPWMVVTFLSLVYDLVDGLIKITDATIIIIITSGIIFIVLSIRSKLSPLWFVLRHLELFLGSSVSASAVISLLLSGRSGRYPCDWGNFFAALVN